MKSLLDAVGKAICLIIIIVLAFGALLYISEDICGYTPHIYFTPYKK